MRAPCSLPFALLLVVAAGARVAGHGLDGDSPSPLPWTYMERELLFADDVSFHGGYRSESADRLAQRVARSAGQGYRVRLEITYTANSLTHADLRRCQGVLQLHLDRRLGKQRDQVFVIWTPWSP